MKIGDKVVVIVHGAGVISEENHIVYGINDETLEVEEIDDIFYKDNKGNYKTEKSMFGFWFEIEGD